MSDEPVPTIIHTHAEDLAFQHYFVRERCEPSVTGFSFKGAAEAPVNPEIELILNDPELAGIIICPSNPYVSIDPILATGDLRQQLIEAPAPVIAVSPIIGGEAVKGPTAKMMQELAVPNSATSIAEHYADLLDGFVIDTVDAELQSQIASARELTITVAPTWMKTLDDRIRLGQHCLDLCQELGQH